MLAHTKDFKEGKWAPSIQGTLVYAMQHARSRSELVDMLRKSHIDVVFRQNEQGRIYGVTFIDHDNREVYNGSRLGKEFSANTFNELFKWWDGIPSSEKGQHTGEELWQHHHYRWNREARWSRQQVSSLWKPILWTMRRKPSRAA